MKLWAGETVSLVGSQVTFLALPLTAILTLHASAVQVAVLASAVRLPDLLVNLPSGVWVDRLRRRPVMIVADLGQALLLLTIPVAATVGILSLGQLYVVAFTTSSMAVVFGNAYQAYLPSLIDARSLPEGNSRLGASRSLSQIAGPGLAGFLIQVLTAPIAILADAASFLISVFALTLIRHHEPPPIQRGQADTMWREALNGVRFVLRHPIIRPVMSAVGAANLFLSAVAAVQLVFMTDQLHLGPGVIGILLSLFGPAGLVGVLLAPRIGRWVGVGPAIILGGILYGLGALALPLAGGSQEEMVIIIGAGYLIMGFGAPSYFINFQGVEQLMTPPELRGRVAATTSMIALGTAPIGALLGGVMGTLIGLRPLLLISGLGVVLAFGLLCLTLVRRLKSVSPSASQEPGMLASRSTGDSGRNGLTE